MLLDSNILIAYLNGEKVVIENIHNWFKRNIALFISSISVAEVLSLPVLTPKEVIQIKKFLDYFIVLPFDYEIAETASFFRRKYKLKLPDAGIAATAFLRNLPLVTRDKEFTKIKELTILEI